MLQQIIDKYHTPQKYEEYTLEHHKIWEILFDRQSKNLDKKTIGKFFKGLQILNLKKNRIPNYDDINFLLKDLTGFQIFPVNGIVDDESFFYLLSERKFPVTTWIRKENQLDYIEEPDLFHDLFGHVPFLTYKPYTDYLMILSKLYLKNKANVEELTRLYWFTVEFGLIGTKSNRKIFGSGILSSYGETNSSLHEKNIRYFDIDEIIKTDFTKSTVQTKYFLFNDLEEIKSKVIKYYLK